MAPKAKTAFGYQQMALMEWIVEGKGTRFATSSNGDLGLYQTGAPDSEGKVPAHRVDHGAEGVALIKRLGGRTRIDVVSLERAGYLHGIHPLSDHEGAAQFLAKLQRERGFHFSARIILPTDQGMKWWKEEGRGKFAAMRQKVEAEMAAVARVVLVGKQARIDRPHGYRDDHVVPSWVRAALPVTVVMVPIALAKVVKETDSRIYVEGLTQPDGEGKFEGDYTVVKGSPPNQYVEKDAVMADHATPETARRITGILADFSGSYEAAGSRLESAVKPLLAQETLRIRQAETQMLDMLREALAECAENAGGAAAVESEDDGGGFKP